MERTKNRRRQNRKGEENPPSTYGERIMKGSGKGLMDISGVPPGVLPILHGYARAALDLLKEGLGVTTGHEIDS